MEMKTKVVGDVEVLILQGRFDSFEAPTVDEWVMVRLQYGHNRLVMDFSGVEFIDSTALAVLVKNMKSCRESGGNLVLANLQPPVSMVFELTQLQQAFNIYQDLKSAVRHFLS